MAALPYLTLFFVFALLIAADKGLTFFNIVKYEDKHPEDDSLKIEKNPISRYFFLKFGLIEGMILVFILHLGLLAASLYFVGKMEHPAYGVYGIWMLLGAVVINNSYFALRYSGVMP